MVNTPTAHKPPTKWRAFKYHFARSTYVSAFWSWFLGLMGKAAEPVLTATVVYSTVKMLPNITIPANIDTAVFITQQLALDIGGLSLGKLAEQARKDGNEAGAQQARRVSNTLIGIMIAGVVMATIEHFATFPASLTTGIEATLLIARAVMAVLYGRAIHALKKEATDEQDASPTSVPPVDVEALTETITRRLEADHEARFEMMRRQLEAAHEARANQRVSVSEATDVPQIEAPKPPREARKPKREATAKVLPLRQPGAVLPEKRLAVYRLIEQDANLSSYAISEQTGIPVSTVQRYLKDWKARLNNEAEGEATGTNE
jgi:hypothetical protein